MGVIEAIKKGFGIASKMLLLIAVLFVFNAVWNIGSLPFSRPAGGAAPAFSPAAFVFSVIFILASIFVQGGTLGLVRDNIKAGTLKLADFLGYGLKYYLKLLALGALIALLVIVVALLATLMIALTAPLNNIAITVLAVLVAIIIGGFGLYLVVLLMMAPYALVCDEAKVIDAMKKSITFVRKNVVKVLGLLVLLILISFGISFVIVLLAGLVTMALPAAVGQIIIGLISSAVNSYLGIVMIGSLMSFFLALTASVKPAEPQPAS
ncbi:MAG: hypothetical protein ABIJ27_02855 [Candidatus Omnitrophota bacterium]